jgi:recombination protein RecA
MSKAEKLAEEIQDTVKACEVLDLPDIKEWCTSGATILDLAISNVHPGGWPIGRIVQVYGGASTAKSVLATTILGSAIRSGKHAFYADIEHTLDPVFASYYGLDCSHENFHYGFQWHDKRDNDEQPRTLEDFFDEFLAGLMKLQIRKPRIVVVDSLTALPAKIEVEKGMDQQGFGAYRAKQISLGLRKYLNLFVEKDVTLFIVDQTRDNVGGGQYAPPEVTTGGRGAEFYSSVRVYLRHGTKVMNSHEKEIGVWVNFQCAKNKVAPPFRKGKFKILFDYGLDDIATNLSFLAEEQKSKDASYKLTTPVVIQMCCECGRLLPPESEGCSCGGGLLYTCNKCHKPLASDSKGCSCTKEKTGKPMRGLEKQVQHWLRLVEDEGRESELQEVTAAVWKEVYRTPERKPREW